MTLLESLCPDCHPGHACVSHWAPCAAERDMLSGWGSCLSLSALKEF